MNPLKVTVEGYQVVDARVGPGGNSGRVYVPKKWIGQNVRVVLLTDPDAPPSE